MRRTWNIDITFPSGVDDKVVADVRGRDLRVDDDGGADAVDAVSLTIDIELPTSTITGVDVRHAAMPLEQLVGAGVRSGFGRQLAGRFPDEAARRTLGYSVLEDLGGAMLVSGYARVREGQIALTPDRAELAAAAQADICIGWAADGPIIETIREYGRNPMPIGPLAPRFDRHEVLAWHEMDPPARSTARRRRRLDVEAGTGDSAIHVQEHFRDTYAGPDGEMVLHEYLVDARAEDGRLVAIEVAPRVLPWDACPGAAASAQRLLGTVLDEIPARVRTELVGTTTCTHLNSSLRCLADARALADQLRS
jgi:hypothetical protein